MPTKLPFWARLRRGLIQRVTELSILLLHLLAAALCAGAAAGSAAAFLPHQALWIDESTQLNGINMGPRHIVPFLTGTETYPNVSPDRMPPGSYWAGQFWWRAFVGVPGGSTGIVQMRWFAVFCVALAAAIVFTAGRFAYGMLGGLAAGFIFALSPNVATIGVEIRAYPVLILLAALTFYYLVRQVIAPAHAMRKIPLPSPPPDYKGREQRRRGGGGWIIAMSLAGIVAMYVHFFGLVMIGSLLAGSLAVRIFQRRTLTPIVAGAILTLAAAVGLWPFISAARTISFETSGGGISSVARLAYRLIGHPAIAVSHTAIAAALLSALGLAVIAIATAVRLTREKVASDAPSAAPEKVAASERSPVASVIIAVGATLLAGFIVVTIASIAVHSFHSATQTYNCWMLPGVALLLAGGLSPRAMTVLSATKKLVILRGIACALLLILLAADGYGIHELATHGEYFSHGPCKAIAATVDRLGPDNVALFNDEGENLAASIYFPLRYLFGTALLQYRVDPQVTAKRNGLWVYLCQIGLSGDEPREPSTDDAVQALKLPMKWVMVVQSCRFNSAQLDDAVRHGLSLTPPGPVEEAFEKDPHWKHVDTRELPGFFGARVDLFQRIGS